MILENGKITTSGGYVFEPWTNGYAVGFKVTHTDGRVEFIYLNPSGADMDDKPNLFMYVGPDGDSATDPTACDLDLFEDKVRVWPAKY